MLQIFKAIIDAVWQLLCIPFTFDGFTITTWNVFAFVALIAITLNMIFKKQGGD